MPVALGFSISTSIAGYWAKFQAYGFRVQGSEFRVKCLGFMDCGLGCWFYGLRIVDWVWGVGCRVHSSEFGL